MSRRTKGKKVITKLAKTVNGDLLDRFFEVFDREPNEDDKICLCETENVIGMSCNDEVFAIVDAVGGRVYRIEDFGLKKPCRFDGVRFI